MVCIASLQEGSLLFMASKRIVLWWLRVLEEDWSFSVSLRERLREAKRFEFAECEQTKPSHRAQTS